ncbi:hypothetical protein HDU91_000361 [Kappamyces sp. JEL0680]|nr:hypothetical protein HDU91_000361 [Kappamyces sp. JEL0680]
MTKHQGIWKLMLTPSEHCPHFHDCCQPNSCTADALPLSPKHSSSTLSNASEPKVHFWDLTLKQGLTTLQVFTMQEKDPGNDALSLSTAWSDAVLGKHDQDSAAHFSTQVVKVGPDAASIIGKHFPFMAGKECLVIMGAMVVTITDYDPPTPVSPLSDAYTSWTPQMPALVEE